MTVNKYFCWIFLFSFLKSTNQITSENNILDLNAVQFFIQNVFKLIQDSLVTSATNAQTVLLLFQQKKPKKNIQTTFQKRYLHSAEICCFPFIYAFSLSKDSAKPAKWVNFELCNSSIPFLGFVCLCARVSEENSRGLGLHKYKNAFWSSGCVAN